MKRKSLLGLLSVVSLGICLGMTGFAEENQLPQEDIIVEEVLQETSPEEVGEIAEKPVGKPVEEPKVDSLEEIPGHFGTEGNQEVKVPKPVPETPAKKDVELPLEEETTPIEPEASGEDLAAQKKDLEKVIANWLNEGLITEKTANSFLNQLKDVLTQGEIDVLFTEFYDTEVVPQALEIEAIVKAYEDEIASWVSLGYITEEEEMELLYTLNEYGSLEEMAAVMFSFRQMIQELLEEPLEEVVEVEEPLEENEETPPSVIVPQVVVPNPFLPKNKLPKQQLIDLETKPATNAFSLLPKTGEEKGMVAMMIGLMVLTVYGKFYLRDKNKVEF